MASKTQSEIEGAPADVGIQPVTMDHFAQLIERMPKGLSGEDLLAILDRHSQNTAAQAEKVRVVRHSNADHEHKSAFSYPEGDLARPKPRHVTPDGRARQVFFNGARESEEQLTPAEIDAYNAITESREAKDGRWKAVIDQNGKRLLITVPSFTPDDRGDVPPLILVLRELALGAKAADPSQMAARLAALEQAMAQHGIVVPG